MEEKDNNFIYHNIKFKPIRNFTKIEKEKCWRGNILNYYEWLDINGYSHCDFYKQSKKVNGETIDIFSIENGLLKGLLVVPCTNYLAVIKNEDNYFIIEICKKISELYEELYSSKTSLFRENPIAQIYWDNKKGYEFEILVDFENKSIIFKVDTLEFETIKFNNFYSLYEWLKDKNITYFEQKYSDRNITSKIVYDILDGVKYLSDYNEKIQEIYILFIYKHILYYIYNDTVQVNLKLKDYDTTSIKVQNRHNEDVLLDIKNDVLTKMNLELNKCLFDNEDFD